MDKWIDKKLDCGVYVRSKTVTNKNMATEFLEINFYDFYEGSSYITDSGNLNNPHNLAQLFKELAEKNFTLKGLSLNMGRYDSVDGVTLTATKEYEIENYKPKKEITDNMLKTLINNINKK